MDAAFLYAAVPEPYRVFGRRLKPLSLGHMLLMHRFDCAFVTGGKPDIGDLFFGVWVCSHTYEEALRLMDTKDFGGEMKRWRKTIRRGGRWFGLLPMRAIDVMVRSKLFAEYLDEGSRCPKFFMEDSSNNKSNGAPALQMLRVVLMRDLGLSDAEVMNRPLALSWYDYVTLAELNGRVRLFDAAEHAELQREADLFESRLQKGTHGNG